MSAHPAAVGVRDGAQRGRRPLLAAFAAEQRKLLAQGSIRTLAVVCLLGPPVFALLVSRQSGVPGDSLLGVWVHSSGYAIGFVVLDFAGYLGFPILAGLVAGDLFAAEDRYGTWKMVITRSRGRGEIFAAKVLAGCALACGLTVLAGVASIAGGLLFAGSGTMVDLGGSSLAPGQALGLLAASWLLSLPVVVGFVAIAVLLSVWSRSGIVGVVGTVLIGLLMQLLSFVGNGSPAGYALLGTAFDDWHGLLADPRYYGPLLIALAVAAAWTAVALGAAWLLLRRREFAGPPVSGRHGWLAVARPVLVAAVVLVALSAASRLAPTAVTRARLAASISQNFERLTILQQRELGHAVPAHERLPMLTRCTRRSGTASGPGDDWTCTMTLLAGQRGWDPLSLTPVTYDVSVKSNGCFKAEAPPTFVGQQTMRDAHGASVVNPLFTIYGCFDPIVAGRCPATPTCAFGAARTTAPPTNTARPVSPADRARQQRQLREAERQAGPKVIREQEESVRGLEREEREQREGGSG